MKRRVYLFITESVYGEDMVVFGTYRKALDALYNRMTELFERNAMDENARLLHKGRAKDKKSYHLPLDINDPEYEHGYIIIKNVL